MKKVLRAGLYVAAAYVITSISYQMGYVYGKAEAMGEV